MIKLIIILIQFFGILFLISIALSLIAAFFSIILKLFTSLPIGSITAAK
ncbi:hypothetical protein F900_01529 [Acinetobacter modestus]|uniref:Uncharacterized protein n=1 Tax=Acinetobacter modestus TaxID=1776740 RepID=N9LZT0_9GAMM|nr:hypothetical protein F900_01529 [Acinetobacter modestus]